MPAICSVTARSCLGWDRATWNLVEIFLVLKSGDDHDDDDDNDDMDKEEDSDDEHQGGTGMYS